jgi:peptide/nickel transport system substrate-binding protein
VTSITNIPDETKFEIIDEYTVRFTLPEPDGLSLVKFRWFFQAAPSYLAEHKVAEKNWLYLPEPGPWGTGPFKLVEGGVPYAKPTERVVLDAYEGYWDPEYPKVKKVIFNNTLIGDRKEAVRLCRETEGEVDIVTHIRPLDTLKVAESPFAKVVKDKDAWLQAFINLRKTGSKWRDIGLRKALNYAINREELLKYGARGNAYNLGGAIPEGVYGHNPNLEVYTYDTEKARSLLSEASYPNGFETKIITHEALKTEAQIIKRMLERIGLKVTLDVTTVLRFYRKIYVPILEKPPAEQDWDLALHSVPDFYAHSGLTYLILPLLEGSNIRWIEYDPVYEKMWSDMARPVDPATQEQMIRELMKYAYDSALCLYIYSPLSLYAVNKEVNFVPQKFGYLRLKETSVTDKHWSVREENE